MTTSCSPGAVLRCPICLAPLVENDRRDPNVANTGWVCSRYPFGYTQDATRAIPEAGCCPINGYRRADRLERVCMHAKEGRGGWSAYLDAPYLVPVQDTLVDLLEDSKAGGGDVRA